MRSLEEVLSGYKTCKNISLSEILALHCRNNKLEKGGAEILDLAQDIRTWIKDIVHQCLTENDSSTHIIVKDLFEKL